MENRFNPSENLPKSPEIVSLTEFDLETRNGVQLSLAMREGKMGNKAFVLWLEKNGGNFDKLWTRETQKRYSDKPIEVLGEIERKLEEMALEKLH